MPNLQQHLSISTVAGGLTYFAMCRYYNRQPDLGELLVCGAAGLVAGVAPDALEPAIHPDHRTFCHSLAVGTAITNFALVNCSKAHSDWEEFLKIVVAVTAVCYICHLIADACTPKGLPLLGG